MRPSSWHVHSDNFGAWPYISSEYDREKQEVARQRRHAEALRVSDHDFLVPKAVLPLKGLCCFTHYDYDLCPYPVYHLLLLIKVFVSYMCSEEMSRAS